MNLNLSKDLQLPVEFLSLRKVVYGGSGAGKTSTGRVIFEEATRAGVPCGVIDLKGDWWGLKSTADGKSEGHPVVIFGGDHQDVPIHENGGAELAEIVAELRQPFIIDLEQFSKGKQLKFLAPFFDRLYDKNREALVLICDEADRYIPQRMFSKDVNVAMCLGAGEDIAKRGRKHGIFPMFISQRNADLNKSVTELCEVALVFRTSGPNDQKAVNDWFEAKGNLVTEEQRALVMDRIAGLPDGRAIVCSAHPHMPMFKEVQMRLPETFDSSATPEIGKELIKPKKLARVELASLTDRMKATIEQAKANDPAELKRMLTAEKRRGNELEQALQKANKTPAKQETKIEAKEVPVLTDEDEKWIARAEKAADKIAAAFQTFSTGVTSKLQPFVDELRRLREIRTDRMSAARSIKSENSPQKLPRHSVMVSLERKRHGYYPSSRASGSETVTVSHLPIGERKILEALIQYPDGLQREQLTVLTTYKRSSRDTYIHRLREKDLIEVRGETVVATPSGIASLPNAQPLPTGEALQELWRNKLPQGERAIFEIVISAFPDSVSRDVLSEQTGYKRSSRDTYLHRMRSKQIITEPTRGEIRASEQLFE